MKSIDQAMMSGVRLQSVAKISGWLLLFEGMLLCVPCVVGILYGESDWSAFAIAAAAAVAIGALLSYVTRHAKTKLHRREGYLLTSTVWILFSGFGMIPFLLCSHPLDVASAFFETMSGFTTTGASVIVNVESQSHSVLLWRALTQWIGGLGIVLFLLALLPALNQAGGLSVYNAETTGITHDKIHPRIRQTAASLWKIYVTLTLTMTALLWLGPMNFFDSLCQSMTAMSTGGFSTRNASIAAWHSDYVTAVITVFMFVAGVNFILLYGVWRGDWHSLWRSDVFRAYLGITIVAYLIFMAIILIGDKSYSLADVFLNPMFHIVSALTSTGFSISSDYTAWGSLGVGLTLILMILGACAGSTTGGLKIDRVVVLSKNIKRQIHMSLFPNHLVAIEVGGKQVDARNMASVTALLAMYLIAISGGTLLMAAQGRNLIDAFFTTVSCVSNNGLGYGITGAGFGDLSAITKWVMAGLMLIGRLEFFTVITLFSAAFWRR